MSVHADFEDAGGGVAPGFRDRDAEGRECRRSKRMEPRAMWVMLSQREPMSRFGTSAE